MGRIVREDGSLAASCEDEGKDGRRDHDRNLMGWFKNLQLESEKKEWIRQEEVVRSACFNIKSKFESIIKYIVGVMLKAKKMAKLRQK